MNKHCLNCSFMEQPNDYSITFNPYLVDVSKLPLLDVFKILNYFTSQRETNTYYK